jgi:TrmH family RNA methyltransferase
MVDLSLAEALAGSPRLVVLCDQVRDPGNLGTVIRCADAFGADAVLISAESVDAYNAKTVRASTGSIFHLPLVVDVDLAEAVTLGTRRGWWCSARTGRLSTRSTTSPAPANWLVRSCGSSATRPGAFRPSISN